MSRPRAGLAAFMALAATLSIAGCEADRGDAGSVIVRGDVSTGYPVGAVAWLNDGSIYYLMAYTGESDSPLHLYRTPASGGHQGEIVVHYGGSCDIPYLVELRRLVGGTLGATVVCPQQHGVAPSVVVVDPGSGRSEVAVDLPEGDDGLWSPIDNTGWVIYNNDGCMGVAPINRKGRQQFPALEPAGLLPWPLDGDFTQGPASCPARGMAGFPEVEPVSGRLFILASPEAQGIAPGVLGQRRQDLPWHVYAIDPAERKVYRMGGDFVRPEGMAVSTMTNKVFVSGTEGGRPGLYTVDIADGRVELVAAGRYSTPALSPDGTRLAVVRSPNNGLNELIIKSVN